MNPSTMPVLGMVLKGFPRISETFISNEILLLEKLGFCIHLFSMRRPRENFSHESVQAIQAKVDYLPETLIRYLPRLLYHNLRCAASKPRPYAKALKVACRRFVRTRKSATIKHLMQAGYLTDRLLPASGVTHLHAHFAHTPTSVAMFTSYLTGLPFSFTAHAKDIYTSDPAQLREKIEQARFVVTCTEYNRDHLLKLSAGTATPVHRIYHGIDTALFGGRNGSARKAAEPYRLLTIARLTAKKGLPTVLEAVRLLRERNIALEHTLIGDGDDRRKTLALIEELGLTSITRWLGTQPHHEVVAHFRRADLFILGCEVAPDGDRDGIPNVLLESMAMEVPVVVTDVSAIPELVQDGETGLLVPPGQPRKMADAMLRMLIDEDLRCRIVAAARQRVTESFDNRQLVRDLAQLYAREGLGSGEEQKTLCSE